MSTSSEKQTEVDYPRSPTTPVTSVSFTSIYSSRVVRGSGASTSTGQVTTSTVVSALPIDHFIVFSSPTGTTSVSFPPISVFNKGGLYNPSVIIMFNDSQQVYERSSTLVA